MPFGTEKVLTCINISIIIATFIINLCAASKQLIEPIVAYAAFPCVPGVECQELVFEVPQE